MRFIYVGLFLCALAHEAGASERAAQLVNSFQVMCTIEPLDFARSEARVTAMRLPFREDLRSPHKPLGAFCSLEIVAVAAEFRPARFRRQEGVGPKGPIKACGIGAGDVGKDDFQAEMVKTMKLGQPATEGVSADGTLSTAIGRDVFKGLELMFSGRRDRTGIYLFLQTPMSR